MGTQENDQAEMYSDMQAKYHETRGLTERSELHSGTGWKLPSLL
jgi:hypothetical protein